MGRKAIARFPSEIKRLEKIPNSDTLNPRKDALWKARKDLECSR